MPDYNAAEATTYSPSVPSLVGGDEEEDYTTDHFEPTTQQTTQVDVEEKHLQPTPLSTQEEEEYQVGGEKSAAQVYSSMRKY